MKHSVESVLEKVDAGLHLEPVWGHRRVIRWNVVRAIWRLLTEETVVIGQLSAILVLN